MLRISFACVGTQTKRPKQEASLEINFIKLPAAFGEALLFKVML